MYMHDRDLTWELTLSCRAGKQDQQACHCWLHVYSGVTDAVADKSCWNPEATVLLCKLLISTLCSSVLKWYVFLCQTSIWTTLDSTPPGAASTTGLCVVGLSTHCILASYACVSLHVAVEEHASWPIPQQKQAWSKRDACPRPQNIPVLVCLNTTQKMHSAWLYDLLLSTALKYNSQRALSSSKVSWDTPPDALGVLMYASHACNSFGISPCAVLQTQPPRWDHSTHCMQTVLHLLVTVWRIPDPGSGCSWTMLESCKKCSQTDIALAAVLHKAAKGINSIIANAHRTWCKHYVHVPHLLVSCTHIYNINSITCQCWRAQRLFAILNAFGMHACCPLPIVPTLLQWLTQWLCQCLELMVLACWCRHWYPIWNYCYGYALFHCHAHI